MGQSSPEIGDQSVNKLVNPNSVDQPLNKESLWSFILENKL
jgi:hypothetical protein